MSGLRFGIACPHCGEPMVHENSSPPMDCGKRSTAILRCDNRRSCPRQQVVVELITMGQPPPLPKPVNA